MCLMGLLLVIGRFKFLIDKYEFFHNRIRRKNIIVDRERLTRSFAILYFSTGIPIIITSVIGLIYSEIYKLISLWFWIALAVIAIIGVTYLNVSKRYIKTIENSNESI